MFISVARVGFEPTAFLVLNQDGLPVAYRADYYPEQGSNLQTLEFKSSRSASWRIWAGCCFRLLFVLAASRAVASAFAVVADRLAIVGQFILRDHRAPNALHDPAIRPVAILVSKAEDTTLLGELLRDVGSNLRRTRGSATLHRALGVSRLFRHVGSPFRVLVSLHRVSQSSPGWTRTTDPLLVRKLPLPLGHRTARRKPRDSNPQVAGATNCFQDSVLIQPDDFRKLRGLESNQHQSIQSAPSYR